MNKIVLATIVSTLVFCAVACQKDNPKQQIDRLEKAMATNFNAAQADSLLLLYSDAIKEHPDDHAANFSYLIKSAELQYTHKKDANTAAKTVDNAIAQHGQGQDLAEGVVLCAAIWSDYTQKNTANGTLSPETVVTTTALLDKNTAWLDSSLLRLDRVMGSPVITDRKAAERFIVVAENYADLIRETNPDKYVDLLLKSGGLAKTIEEPNKALQLYQTVVNTHAKHAKAPTALFMTGFVYENDLGDLTKAKAVYEQFLREYPNDPDFADDAKMALKMLGKTPEEIIKAAGN